MATSPTTQWAQEPTDDADVAWLLRTLFAEPAPQEATPPSCGLDAAFERIDRHLDWFDRDARVPAPLSEVA